MSNTALFEDEEAPKKSLTDGISCLDDSPCWKIDSFLINLFLDYNKTSSSKGEISPLCSQRETSTRMLGERLAKLAYRKAKEFL